MMLIPRAAEKVLTSLSKSYQALVMTGPRQSGKTTLTQIVFPNKHYVSLEELDMRDFATNDPRGFLNQYPDGAILDEVQRS
ncbi:MAG: AAA family ATPase [Betaproteobacteria bacterium]|nr:AAA family ATPase [Betaproteobacteria bacterium]